HEDRIPHAGNDLRIDAPSDECAARREKIQSTISRLRSIDAHKNVERPITNCRLLFQGQLRDQRWWIGSFTHLFLQPRGLFGFLVITKKVIDVLEARAGENSFATYVLVFLPKILR